MTRPNTHLSVLSFRGYRTGDADAMYALDLECFAPPFRFSRRAMRGFAEAPNALVLLAESGTPPQLAGFVVAHIERETAYIVTLDVAHSHRRHGLARQLMRELESRARSAAAREGALHVFTGNHAAIRLYESLGYDRVRTAENFYGKGLHALVYRKSLAG